MILGHKITSLLFITLLVSLVTFPTPILADEEHAHPEEKEDHHHPPRKKKKEPGLGPGEQEVRINLSGPFCHRHPEEIREALMKLMGVKSVEGFSGRRYIMVQYKSDHITPEEMAAEVDKLGGSGWKCKGTPE